ncbi:MAG: hypothetical protein ACF8R7_14625 [Phycisphaerales bacterium JB039]
MRRALGIGFVVVGATALGGCFSQYNSTSRIGGVVDLNDVDPSAPTAPASGLPSVTSIDRLDWPRQALLVPQDAVVTGPSYAPTRSWTAETARQRGESPGTTDAMVVHAEDNQSVEGWVMPLAAIYDLIAILPRMLATPPTEPILNPRVSYERATPRWDDALPVTGSSASEEAAAEADRRLRERFGEALLLDEPPVRKAPMEQGRGAG